MKKRLLGLFLLLALGFTACMDEDILPEEDNKIEEPENVRGETEPPKYPTYPVYPPMPVGS